MIQAIKKCILKGGVDLMQMLGSPTAYLYIMQEDRVTATAL
jgi:hypothetical protein